MSGTQFAMVSEWMPNGNIDQYVKAHRDADRFELVSFSLGSCHPHFSLMIPCFPQLADVAKGLMYMHSQGMIHGDLKGVRSNGHGRFPSSIDSANGLFFQGEYPYR